MKEIGGRGADVEGDEDKEELMDKGERGGKRETLK